MFYIAGANCISTPLTNSRQFLAQSSEISGEAQPPRQKYWVGRGGAIAPQPPVSPPLIIPKILKCIRMLRELRTLISTKHLVSFYQAMVLSYFDYCSVVWGNCGIVLKNKLQTLQNRAARIITRYGYEVRSSEILSSLGWCDLETRRKRQNDLNV